MAVSAGKVEHGAATVTHPHDQLMPPGGSPEPTGVGVVDDGAEALGHDIARRMRALPGGNGVDVTRHTSAPGTCDVDVPRIWRTPSTM